MNDSHKSRPLDQEAFLIDILALGTKAEEESVRFEKNSGERHPKTITEIGIGISYVYRAACCYWGCQGGNHSIERLLGKAVNQSISAFKLYRMGYYDESLMLTRGIGEIANLLHLFAQDKSKLTEWETLDEKQRYHTFKPSQVRKLVKEKMEFVPVDSERYSKLCAVGTHPNPDEIPGHFTGTGVPILGMVVQPVGAYVSITELGYALGLVLVTIPKLLGLESGLGSEMKACAVDLIRNLGYFTILNYNEGLKKAYDKESERQKKSSK